MELDSPAVSALGVRSRKLSNALNGQSWDGRPKSYQLELLRVSEGTLVPAAFAVVSTHQSALGPRGGLWPVLFVGGGGNP
jgi:hypothetical protein